LLRTALPLPELNANGYANIQQLKTFLGATCCDASLIFDDELG
jgi:hypothetical protein